MSFFSFLKEFLKEEFKWGKTKATRDQIIPLMYAYFLNFLFFPYNLMVKVKNYLILKKIILEIR